MAVGVSVVIPSYNHRAFVVAAIDSVLVQSLTDLELIIIDDGSVDGSKELITAYLEKVQDDRARLLAVNHRGLVPNLIDALAMAEGEYFACLASDDLWEPSKLSKQVATLKIEPRYGACFSDYWMVDAQGRRLYRASDIYPFRGGQIFDCLWSLRFGPPMSGLFRRRALADVGGFDPESELDDLPMWLRLTRRFEVSYIHEPLASFRLGENRRTTDFEMNRRCLFDAFEQMALSDPSLTVNRHRLALRLDMAQAHTQYQQLHFRDARRFALAVLRNDPRSRGAWKVMLRSLLGRRIVEWARSRRRMSRIQRLSSTD